MLPVVLVQFPPQLQLGDALPLHQSATLVVPLELL